MRHYYKLRELWMTDLCHVSNENRRPRGHEGAHSERISNVAIGITDVQDECQDGGGGHPPVTGRAHRLHVGYMAIVS